MEGIFLKSQVIERDQFPRVCLTMGRDVHACYLADGFVGTPLLGIKRKVRQGYCNLTAWELSPDSYVFT